MKIKTGIGTITLFSLIAIYSLSVVTSLPGLAISPILGDLQHIFKDASDMKLQLLESLPSFVIIPFILLAGKLSISNRKYEILIAGLGIFVISSLLYFTAHSMNMLLIYSVLLGIGAGIVIPFSTGLIADFFQGDQRIRQLGIVSAVSNLSLVLATLLAGFLAGISWKYAFGVYCISIISFILSFFIRKGIDVPLPARAPKATGEIQKSTLKKIWPMMFLYLTATFIVLAIPFNLSLLISKYHIGSSDYSGTIISLFFLAIMVPGLFIKQIANKWGDKIFFFSFIALMGSIAIFAFARHTTTLTLITLIAGGAYGILQPLIYDKTSVKTSHGEGTFALSLVMSMNYLAIIIYPFIMKIAGVAFPSGSVIYPFIINALLCAGILILIYKKQQWLAD